MSSRIRHAVQALAIGLSVVIGNVVAKQLIENDAAELLIALAFGAAGGSIVALLARSSVGRTTDDT